MALLTGSSNSKEADGEKTDPFAGWFLLFCRGNQNNNFIMLPEKPLLSQQQIQKTTRTKSFDRKTFYTHPQIPLASSAPRVHG